MWFWSSMLLFVIIEPDVFIVVKLLQCHNYIFLLSSPIVRQVICFIVLQGGLAIAINYSLDPDFVNSKVSQALSGLQLSFLIKHM